MLTEIPKKCPLCNGDWLRSDTINHFVCPNAKECRMILSIADGAHYYLHKYFEGGGEIWWTSNTFAEFRWKNSGYKKLSFDPPFDIQPARLKLLILFS